MKTPIDLAMWVKLHNLIVNKKADRGGQVVVELLKNADLSTMVPKEKLALVSHGNETSFGGFDVDALAKELISRKIRPDISSVKLSGCLAGSDQQGTPYCTALSRKLYDLTKGLPTPIQLVVTGFVNNAVTFPDGKVRSKIAGKDPATGPKYQEIIDKYKKSGQFASWVDMASKMPYDSPQHIIESAQFMDQCSSDMFKELYHLNSQVTYGKDDSKRHGTWQ